MRFGSVCSGIEAASVAWAPLGWEAAFFAEIEAFPCAVLSHHYPDVPNRGDLTRFEEWPADAIDVLVGGTPCQSFSVAGRWLIPRGVETAGEGKRTTAHLNLTGRTMADVWGLSAVYHLVSSDGSWLHKSGTCLTTEKESRWEGTAAELDKTRRVLDVANGLRAERVA